MITKNSKFMIKRRILPLALMVVIGIVLWAFKRGGDDSTADSKQQQLLAAIGAILEQRHYSPKVINDSFSEVIFNKYLDNLDPDKDIFTQADVNDLKKFELTIDDEIHGSPIKFFPAAGDLYLKRLDEAMATYKDYLSKPFDFTANESAVLDGDKLNYPTNENARKEAWRKRVKYMTLERFVDLQDQRNKATDTAAIKKESDAQLEKEARDKTLAALDRNYKRIKVLFTPDYQFNSFVNVITDEMDPHTEYFPPIEKRAFDESMSGHFFGIGAQLTEDDGAIKIASLITGSPAWKSGQVQVNDEILKVAQGSAEPIDVAGYGVTDVVKLIRGTKGTEVRITFKKSDGTIQVVSLIRDEIVQDETFARSTIINDGNKKIGYIYLPEFYADFEKPDGSRCSYDVAQEVTKLKKENVEGIILDLRNNGGGSLYEVVQMVGLFIKSGPVVQVKDRGGNPSTLSDNDQSVLYDGPLAVMVNELSASASEIFAAAIQDYHRGIIIGSTSTYGKGTVQKNLPLGKPIDMYGQTEFGALKLTFEKFYRINGGSTQLKGVTPDIVLPDTYEYLKFREKDNSSALQWDQIPKANYILTDNSDWSSIEQKSQSRINANNAFATIRSNTEWLSKNTDKEFSLNINKYKDEQNKIRTTVHLNDSLTRLQTSINMQPVPEDKDKFFNNPDKAKGERYQQWLKNIQSDIYIQETMNIVNDMATSIPANTAHN